MRGVVQGVGFRPFVHRLAEDLGLCGFVGNDTTSVFVEVEGLGGALVDFASRLRSEAPALARIEDVRAEDVPALGEPGFAIVPSRHEPGTVTLVPPDVATCPDCLAELRDPADRRYRYPFVNCTRCGPRFTIIRALPYDRSRTTMAAFALCPDCATEYGDPRDRRHHAEPVACPACGPRLEFLPGAGTPGHRSARGAPALEAASDVLAAGGVLAVKGLGGYHLACDAADPAAVARLRERKRREAKPLAVMVRDLAAARALAGVDAAAAAVLTSPAHPVVLLRKRHRHGPAELAAPGNPDVGIMLPYTPLHHLLLEPVAGAPAVLVMTSGNLSDEPIAYDDTDARKRLAPLADAWLVHDRPIHVPCDDSVVRVLDGEVSPIRRSRGYAPYPVGLPFDAPPTLAVGGEVKNTFCLAAGRHAWMSQHIGDMADLETLHAFEHSVARLTDLFRVTPGRVAGDRHPGYLSARWARERAAASGVPLVTVQHHHAHLAALLAEHGRPPGEPAIGIVFDGAGYGDDATVWGGEVLVGDYAGFRRFAHLAPVPLPGGDAAVRLPRRMALSHLWAAGVPWDADLPPFAAAGAAESRVLARQLETGFATTPTSSMGRLFDAVASLAGLRHETTFEAQAAVDLEAAAAGRVEDGYRFYVPAGGGPVTPTPVVRAVAGDVRAGTDPSLVAARFHGAVADLVLQAARRARDATGVHAVGLTGGVFQNGLLARSAAALLAGDGFKVLVHKEVPPNDGGIALGQAAVAAFTPLV